MSPADHALLCLLWSETDNDGTPLDTLGALPSQSLRDTIREQWEEFRTQAEGLGFDASEHCAMMLHPDCEGDAWNAAAHDFILTRNGHGTGFWDSGRWVEPWGDKLTKLSESFGTFSAYIEDDGSIYGGRC